MHTELVTDEFIAALHTRTLQNLPAILKNIGVFRNAATAVMGDARAGDQIGTLLAGAYSLISDVRANYDIAVAWMSMCDWNEEKGLDMTKDEVALLNVILEHQEIVDLALGGRITRSIGELINIALTPSIAPYPSDVLSDTDAYTWLNRCGIKVLKEQKAFLIANQHSKIKAWLSKTPWSNNHGKLLQRLPGAQKEDRPIRFGSGTQSRATWLPASLVTD
jgi:putative DNA primase/helicase